MNSIFSIFLTAVLTDQQSRAQVRLGNQVAISTREGNNLAGVENGHNAGRDVCWMLLCDWRGSL